MRGGRGITLEEEKEKGRGERGITKKKERGGSVINEEKARGGRGITEVEVEEKKEVLPRRNGEEEVVFMR